MTRAPARRAAAASARPDSAAIRTGRGSAHQVTGGAVSIAEIEGERLFRLMEPLQQRVLRLELDAADGERADADAGRARKRRAVGMDFQPLDARWRHRVEIGGDLEPLRR